MLATTSCGPVTLPDLDCGLCGVRTCAEFARRLAGEPALLKRCIHLDGAARPAPGPRAAPAPVRERAVAACPGVHAARPARVPWQDVFGREFDFYLEHFPEEPGPREVILPRNPMLTRELAVARGDALLGRPLGMSCGCPVTHCGRVTDVDPRTGVITWCVTGPLGLRDAAPKDIGYYSAEAYEGLIGEARVEVAIGMRYFFQPRMCMLQWRHSGLVNYVNRGADGLQVRLEGLWIG